ncbi:MAG: Co2+/Mg2+ efflux protein ApaG [Salinibacter sp.]
MISYASTTRSIIVTVRPIYLDEPSDLLEREFSFGYAIYIKNDGTDEVQLLRRRWIIEEADGSRQDVTGDGNLRPHPVIAPGETHVHDGSCTIESFNGTVEGNYLVQRADGEQFRVSVPSFPLHAAAN